MALKHGDKVQKCWWYHKIILDPPDIFGYYRHTYEEKWSIAYHGPEFRFRYDPVPGVHKHRKWHGHRYRKPSINGEIRLIESHQEFVKIRARRNTRLKHYQWNEDFTVGEYYNNRSWKRTKKRKQWLKGKGGIKRVSSCHDYGIVHGCNEDCPVLLDGSCPVPEEVLENLTDRFNIDEFKELKELYNIINERYKSIW